MKCLAVFVVLFKILELYATMSAQFADLKHEDTFSEESYRPDSLTTGEKSGVYIPLLIKGKAFDVSTSGLQIGKKILFIKEKNDSQKGTGLTSWDGAIVLAKYLEVNKQLVENKVILELGSGTGISGMASVLLDARFTLYVVLYQDSFSPHILPGLG